MNNYNVFNYLIEHDELRIGAKRLDLCERSQQALSKVEPVAAKNFNLLVTFADERKLLVKQERHNQFGKAASEFLGEWRIQEFLQQFSELNRLRPFLPEVLHLDRDNSIIVKSYLDEYRDLMDFYTKEKGRAQGCSI